MTMLPRWINTEQDFLTLAGTQHENVIEFPVDSLLLRGHSERVKICPAAPL